jgi:hypothetical protein
MRWAGHTTLMGEKRGACRILVRRPEGRRPLGRPRRRWEDNIKVDLEVGWGMDWIELTQGRDMWRALVNAVMNLRVPWNTGNFLTSWETVSFSRRPLLHGVKLCCPGGGYRLFASASKCRREYLNRRESKTQVLWENRVTRSLVVCHIDLILFQRLCGAE